MRGGGIICYWPWWTIHWHHLNESWWRAFCREHWLTKWRGFDHHGRWPTAKEAEEDREPGVFLLLRSDLFIFRYLVSSFKIILGIQYHKLYDFRYIGEAHSAIAHRGRDKREGHIRTFYFGISQEVITLFVSLCKLHQQQKSVTNHTKKAITNPITTGKFLEHVEIDLIDFRSLPCERNSKHNWVLHVIDHFSKYSWMMRCAICVSF